MWPVVGVPLLLAVTGYFVGSCPNGFTVARMFGIDIRQHGSGNIGATNVLRVLGKRWGYFVFTVDSLKGLLAVWLALKMASLVSANSEYRELVGIVAGLSCVIGHTFPVWLGFRGGKGVATSAGVLLGLMPLATISVVAVWLLLFQLTRYVSVASVTAAVALPIFVSVYLYLHALAGASLLPFSVVVATLVIWRHRSNIRRLFRGEEPRFEQK